MISKVLRQLSYMAQTKSWAQIARDTGLTTSALRSIRTKGVTSNDDYKRVINNAYTRDAYNRLRNVGFSVSNAKIYSKYRPEIASAYEADMMLKIADLTGGVVASRLNRDNLAATQANINKIYDSIYKNIRNKISESRLTIEEVFDY